MNRLFKYSFFLLLYIAPNSLDAQISTLTLNATKDAFVSSDSTNVNYWRESSLKVYNDKIIQQSDVFRSFIQFNVSSIPKNAIIVSSTLKLFALNVVDSSDHSIYIERADELWYKDSITWDKQPNTYSSDRVSIAANSISSDSVYHEFDVTDHVEQMLWYKHNNHGWRIRLQSESGNKDFGVHYASMEHDSISWRPQLEIEYILPPTITLAVTHSTNGNDDGSVDATYSGGSNGALNYYWLRRRTESTYTNIESGWYPNNSTIDASSLEPGLYVMTIRDSLYASYPDDKFLFYKWFLVGEEGATTDVTFFNSETYMQDTYIALNKDTVDPANWEDLNYDYKNNIGIGTIPPKDGTAYDAIGLARYECDFDQLLEFTKADFITRPWYKYRANNTSNAMTYRKVSSHWQEDIVTYNTRPSVDSTGTISVAQQPTSGTSTDRDTVNILDFIEYWQANPTQNYGMEMSISDLNQAGGAHRQYYDVNFGLASGPLLKLSFTVKPQLKIDFVDSLDHGSITLNSPSGSLPYRYMISHNPIGSLTDVWNTLNDTITNDSITFFRGDINSQNYTFSNLNSGKYYIAVFDNDGAKLVDTSTYLSPDISLVNSTGVTVNGDQISRSNSSQGDGTASFSKLLRNNHSGGIAFEVESLGGFIIGFNNDTDALATATSHFEFGVNIQPNGSYAVIDTGVVTSNTGTIHAGDDIYLVKEGNDFVFYVEDTVAYRHTLHSQLTDDFTVDFVLKDQNIELKRHTLLGQLRFPKPYPSYPKLGCGTTTTDISIKIPVGITLNSCVLTNNQTSAIITPSSSCVYEDVPIGTYTMLVSYSYGSSTFTYPYQLAVGYLVDWENLVDCQIILGTNNTLIPGPGTIAPDWASADSEAKTFNAESGWVQFETDVFGSGASWLGSDPSNFQYLAFEESDGNQAFGVSTNNIFSSGVAAFGDDAITTESFFTSPNGVFRVDLNYNETSDEIEVELYKNGATSLLSTTSLSDNGPFELHTMQYGKPQLINTISSFCPVPQIVQYIEPKRDSEGGYYEVPDDDILRFEFHEEYTTGSDLNYVVRNYQGQEQSLSSIPESFGDNRLSLDVSSLISGYYVMEILNDKNENWFIRFKVL